MEHLSHKFNSISPKSLAEPIIKSIGDEWLLITAGNPDHFNTMTASWGTLGVFWHKPVAICFIRPTRYTYDFVNENDLFTLSFFDSEHHDILQFCGTNSGRNIDKVAETGLTPGELDRGGIGYAQARLMLECRKIYFDDLNPENFLLPDVDRKIYPEKDYHRMYIGEITGCYVRVI